MAVVFTPTETWEYLETPSEQRRDELILRHVQPFQFSALRAIYKFRPQKSSSHLNRPQGWPSGGDWCQKCITRNNQPSRAATNGFFRNFWKGTTKNLKNF